MSQTKVRTFGHTAAALIVYHAGATARAQAWDSVQTAADVVLAENADRNALRLVQLAYHQDTRDINSLENCLRADLAFMQRMAQGSSPILASDAQAQDEVAEDACEYGAADTPAPR